MKKSFIVSGTYIRDGISYENSTCTFILDNNNFRKKLVINNFLSESEFEKDKDKYSKESWERYKDLLIESNKSEDDIEQIKQSYLDRVGKELVNYKIEFEDYNVYVDLSIDTELLYESIMAQFNMFMYKELSNFENPEMNINNLIK